MLRTGAEHLQRLRDGRVVYVGDERIEDVTTHPAFAEGARTIAAIYDLTADPANAGSMSFTEDGEAFAMHYLPARSQNDLRRRLAAHRRIGALTYGMFGRSPDHFAGYVTALGAMPQVVADAVRGFPAHLQSYYRYARHHDHYVCYAVLPPQAARDPAFYQRQNLDLPTLQMVDEDDGGIWISGMKMLATGAAYADEIWIGNIQPLAPDQKRQAVTCAIPVNAPGVSLWSRQPFGGRGLPADYPLSWRFDETDSMVLCDRVRVPWERVFVLDDPAVSRGMYIAGPAHAYGNHQSNVRFWCKLQLILGLASRITQATGADKIPAVRETLGRLAALEATLGGLILGQIEGCETWPGDLVSVNRRYMYAGLNWCVEMHAQLIDILRDLSGGGVFQMPASIGVMRDPALRETFERYWQTPQMSGLDRMRLFKLVWDLVGSDFAGRHLQYEKFYVGATFTLRAHCDREAPWDAFHAVVDGLLQDTPV